ncbi:hypothetical protein HPB58_14515 [Priestia filamentosa]|uniref:hypothetical protein n=1 Tax=Priestia filamentosa TaxID=1402861 RepID=UPI001FB41563|nr:hypothetical protein [Priestia filamentosa]MED3728741.1 hypothetical protein [Priestia filamentosa]UOE58552.1 hypothetical protein HPB58_14515 [Priestia filamentosa]
MKKGMKIGISFSIFVMVVWSLIFINWEHIFGTNRPIANIKALYQLEIKEKDIAKTSNVDNDILYIVPRGHLDTYIKMMSKEGYVLSEEDIQHNKLIFKEGQNTVSITYKRFARKYTIIESPFLEKV